jgi:hypothetical protein
MPLSRRPDLLEAGVGSARSILRTVSKEPAFMLIIREPTASLYFVTWVVIGWSFGNTKVAISLVVTLPLFMPS